MPIIRSLSTAAASSGLRFGRGDSSAVGRGRSDRTDHGQQHCVNSEELIGTTECLTVLTGCRLNRCRYNRVPLC
jgi:hypothetical protein